MAVVLGLDISTSTVGWSIINAEIGQPTLGYIPLSDVKSMYQKATECKQQLSLLISQYGVTDIAIEEDLQKFTKGKSSAATIQKLSKFNGMVSYIVYDLMGKAPVHIKVNDARSIAGCKIIKNTKKNKAAKKVKQQVYEQIMEKLPNYPWPKKILRSGPRKDQEILIPETYDMVDAYVISVAGKVLLEKKLGK